MTPIQNAAKDLAKLYRDTNPTYAELLQKVIDLEKRVENLEHEIKNMVWKDINLQTEIYQIYKGE